MDLFLSLYEPSHEKTCDSVFFGVSNQTVQPQKMARGLKFGIYKVDGLYLLCSENKDADQLRSYCTAAKLLICVFVFAYAKSRFSHEVAHKIYGWT